MFEIDMFLHYLVEDTKSGIIQWSPIINEAGDYLWSHNLCKENPPLETLINSRFNRICFWDNILLSEVMNGIVYVVKHATIPPTYSLYLQTDYHVKISRINAESNKVKDLYDLITDLLLTTDCDVTYFIDRFNNAHVASDKDPLIPDTD